jgi:hypothetical protein
VTEPPPPDFKIGPIAGNLTYLAKLICPIYGFEADRRALKRLHESGAIWVQRVSGQSYKVRFKEGDRPIYAQANAQDLEMKRQQRARNAQEAAN